MNNKPRQNSTSHYEILIKGGLIYDGTLIPPFRADIGINKDRIVAIGDLDATADKTIDAEGCIVTPGFIDIHTHCDHVFQQAGNNIDLVYKYPEWKGNYCYIYQGVTTVVTGNCGYGFTDTAQFLNLIDKVQFGTNVYHLAPHGVIRQELFGADQPDVLSSSQLEILKNRISEEMEKGAIGLSSGLAYAPGCNAPRQEFVELARVVGKHGGYYSNHIRDLSGKPDAKGEPGILSSIRELVEVGKSAGIPLQLSHLQIQEPILGTRASQVLELIEAARAEGLDLTADQYPYDAGSTLINIVLPDKIKSNTGVKPEYKTEAGKKEIKGAINQIFSFFSPEKIVIVEGEYAGDNLKQIALKSHKDAADIYVELVTQDTAPFGIFFQQEMSIVKQLSAHDYVFTASDGWTHLDFAFKAHPRMYGSFTRKIKQFALDEKIMDLTSAIRSMTSLPAAKIGARHRGMLAAGNFADIAVIDLNKIQSPATYEKANVFSTGIMCLLVNGVVEIENGKASGEHGGRGLKKGD